MLKIGDLAKQTGISVGTLRYYESLGLIAPSQRAESGYRYYAETIVQKVQFIRKAQFLQFSLSDIKEVIHIREEGQPACIKVKALLNDKIEQVDRQIQQLHELKVELASYRDQWADRRLDQSDSPQICSLVAEISTVSSSPHLLTNAHPKNQKP